MLIKFDADDVLVDQLKAHYGQKVASKAFSLAAADAPKLSAQIRGLKRDVEDRDREIAVLRQTLERARSAAALLLEACGQGDLIDGSVPDLSRPRRRPVAEEPENGTNRLGPAPVSDDYLARYLRPRPRPQGD